MLLLQCMRNIYLSMVKKIFHIITTFFLGTTLVGIPVNLHYCNGKVYSVGIIKHAHSCCSDESHNHCGIQKVSRKCGNKTFVYKTKDDYIPSSEKTTVNHDFQIFVQHLLITPLIIKIPEISDENNFRNNSPPYFGNVKTLNQALSLLQSFLL